MGDRAKWSETAMEPHTPYRRDKRVTGHEHTMSSYPVVGTPWEDRIGHMQSIDLKGYGRMRGTAADRSRHHPWVPLSGGAGDRNAATEPKGSKAEGQTRRYRDGKAEKEPAALPIPHHWTPLAGGIGDSEAVMGTQTQDSNKLPIGV